MIILTDEQERAIIVKQQSQIEIIVNGLQRFYLLIHRNSKRRKKEKNKIQRKYKKNKNNKNKIKINE